ncbi:MAG: hypothetical protein FWG40_00235 [Peptococcaceae bacterium]|nr:hypothetical protein [Peptococcaceae bacterium]
MSVFKLAIHNIRKAKLRFVMFVVLMGLAYMLIIFAVSSGSMIDAALKRQLETLKSQNIIEVSPRIINDDLPIATINSLGNVVNVSSVLPRYHTSAFLEEAENVPIYFFRIDGLDRAVRLPDYEYDGSEGIVLPDLSVSLMKETKLRDYVGRAVRVVYDRMVEEEVVQEVMEVKVLGVYTTEGDVEGNPAYLSLALFQKMYARMNDNGVPAAKGALVYVEDVEQIDVTAEQIERMGFLTSYGTKNAMTYFNSLRGIRNVIMVVSLMIILLTLMLLMQNLANTLRKREKTIGVMKAYGYRNTKILAMSVIELGINIIAANVLAVGFYLVLAYFAAGLVSVVFYGETLRMTGGSVIVVAVINLIIVSVSLIRPVLRIENCNPVEILKG